MNMPCGMKPFLLILCCTLLCLGGSSSCYNGERGSPAAFHGFGTAMRRDASIIMKATTSRREAIADCLASARLYSLAPGPPPSGGDASSSTTAGPPGATSCRGDAAPSDSIEPRVDCLKDLPRLSDDFCRIYLVRHGQTDRNRRGQFQGARVNAPINGRGLAQADRVGIALGRLGDDCPRVMLHSRLVRSHESARVASRAVGKRLHLDYLPSLHSIDYGPVAGGKDASEVRAGMGRTYGAWTAGYIDSRPYGGGESAREVLNRAAATLRSLVSVANQHGGSAVAISHSTFLRMLLAVVCEQPLEEASTMAQENGCINVIDFRRNGPCRILRSSSTLFYEDIASNDINLRVPVGNVIRINERRHLRDLCRYIPTTSLAFASSETS